MKNKLQSIIKHIKTMFYNLKLCVSLKRDNSTTEKDLCEKENCGKFEDNFDKIYYMANKEEIDKVARLGELTDKLRNHTID